MTDDPRDILKTAGAECAEVKAWNKHETWLGATMVSNDTRPLADAAILALARLVAEQQAKLDDRTERVKQAIERSRVTAVSPQDVLNLIDRVARTQEVEKRDAYLAVKYKWQRDKYEAEIRRCYEALHAEFGNWPPDAADEFFADLNCRWEEHND